jgi:hypothetical protein
MEGHRDGETLGRRDQLTEDLGMEGPVTWSTPLVLRSLRSLRPVGTKRSEGLRDERTLSTVGPTDGGT